MSLPYALSVRRVQASAGVCLLIEHASLESGSVVDMRLTDVPGATYDDARDKLKGRCFVLAESLDGEIARALRALGCPDVETVNLRTATVRDTLTSPMVKRLLPWAATGFVITLVGARAMCVAHPDRGYTPAPSISATAEAEITAPPIVPWAEPLASPPSDWHPRLPFPKSPVAYALRAKEVAPEEYALAIEDAVLAFDPEGLHPEWSDELYRICLRESRCGQFGPVGAHAVDSWTGAHAYLWEVIHGRLDPYSCPEHRLRDYAPVLRSLRTWEREHDRVHPAREKIEALELGDRSAEDFGTRGAFGMNAARAVRSDGPLGPCAPPEALDDPQAAALAAAYVFAECTEGSGLFKRSCSCVEHVAIWVGRGRWALRPFLSWEDKSKLSTVAVQCGRRYASVFAAVEPLRSAASFGLRVLASVGW